MSGPKKFILTPWECQVCGKAYAKPVVCCVEHRHFEDPPQPKSGSAALDSAARFAPLPPGQAHLFWGPNASGLGGLKFDADKPRTDLLDPDALEEVARVLAFGAKKYAAHNWRKGIQASRLLGAVLRHTFALMRGEDKDPESGLHHAAHAICCLMFLFWTLQNKPDMDDRYKQETK